MRIAYYESGTLLSAGGVGSGLTRTSAADLERRLKKFITDKPPVSGLRGKDLVWTKPKIRVEVDCRGWTADGQLRHPTFKAVRED